MATRWRNKNNPDKPTLDAFIADRGCSMAGRRSNNGQCAIRNEPCPPACLLKLIGSLEAVIRMHNLQQGFALEEGIKMP